MTCNGRGGKPCTCNGFKPKDAGEPVNSQSKCSECPHRRKLHELPAQPVLNVDDVVKHVKASKEAGVTNKQAWDEAARGYRPNSTRALSSAKPLHNPKKKKCRESESKLVQIGRITIATCGVDNLGQPNVTRGLTQAQFEDSVVCGWSVPATADSALQFDPAWKQADVDKWIREKLPQPFKYLDMKYPESSPEGDSTELHWKLLGKDRLRVFAINRSSITGAELKQYRGSTGRDTFEHAVRIVTKKRIPDHVYRNLPAVIERLEAGLEEQSGSESDVDSQVAKGKGKAKKRESDAETEDDGDDEDDVISVASAIVVDDDDDYFPDASESFRVKEEPTTRSADFIDGDSEIEVSPPQTRSQRQGLKRAASPPLDAPNHKRPRSTSYNSHHSDKTSIRSSVSPRLRPVTSSFVYDPDTQTPSSVSASAHTSAPTAQLTESTPESVSTSLSLSASRNPSRPRQPEAASLSKKYLPQRRGLNVPQTNSNPWA